MAKQPNWILYVAVALILLGLIEDASLVLLVPGILTSFMGAALLIWKGFGKRRR